MEVTYIDSRGTDPSGNYKIGQIIKVAGKNMKVESYTHTGRSVTVVSMPNAVRFERIVCLVEGYVPRTLAECYAGKCCTA
jgi:hypothetical protein